MSDVDVKIGITVVDQAAKRALGDLGKATDELGKKSKDAGDAGSGSLTKIGKAAQGAGSETEKAKGFFEKLSDTIKTDLDNSGSETLGKLSGLLSGTLVLAAGAATAAVVGLKTWLDLTLHAERENQINRSFQAIAASAGLAADTIRDQLVTAAQGLADTEDILQAANRAIIQLGDNAGVIPQTMELARKATALYGGDVVSNFDKLNDAIATGNTRLLRTMGLTINTEEAQDKFAASIGTTRDRLNEAGQKQAFLNAVLETAKTKFKDVDETSINATNAVTRFGVAMGNLKDVTADTVSNSGFFTSAMDTLTNMVKDAGIVIGGFGGKSQDVNVRISQTKEEIEQLTATIDTFTKRNGANHPWLEGPRAELARMQTELAALEAQTKKTAAEVAGTTGTEDGKGTDKGKFTKDDKKSAEEIANAAAQERAKLEAVGNAREEMLNAIRDNEMISEAEYAERKRQVLEDSLIAESELLDKQYADKKLKEEDYHTQKQALAEKFALDSVKLQTDLTKRQLDLEKKKKDEEKKLEDEKKNYINDTLSGIASLTQTKSKELFAIGKAASLAQASINTYEAITKTMASVPYPFNIPLAAAQGIAGAVQVANIASMQPAFANGGIVPGSSYSGDKVQARVNSGEMILNDAQQARLFQLANGQGGNDQQLAMISAVLNQPISIQIDGKEIINVTRSQLAGGRSFS